MHPHAQQTNVALSSKDPKRNFYHHSSIYRLEEYKQLTKEHFYLQTESK